MAESYDDRPVRSDPNQLPASVQAPLAAYGGAEPPAPQWFKDATAHQPERSFVTSLGTKLEVLTWGELGKPGLLFVHGNSAHADWWSFIAPFFAADYRVAAFSLAGMGASDWREVYSFPDFAEDAEAVAQAAGLYEGPRKPVYVGHSFGGMQVFFAAATRPERMHSAILVDTGFGGPPPEVVADRQKRLEEIRSVPSADRTGRIYPTMEAALARFRLMPPQPALCPFAADFIARRSLKQVPLPDGSGEGWTWRFDPEMWGKLNRSGLRPAIEAAAEIVTPVAHIYGERSRIIARRKAGQMIPFPEQVIEIEIPDCEHHVMIDQPLALVATLRALLTAWPVTAERRTTA